MECGKPYLSLIRGIFVTHIDFLALNNYFSNMHFINYCDYFFRVSFTSGTWINFSSCALHKCQIYQKLVYKHFLRLLKIVTVVFIIQFLNKI